MSLAMVQGTALAATLLTTLYIGSTQVTLPSDGGMTYSNGTSESDSTWWVSNSGGAYTLTLSGANITDQHNWTNTYTASIYADGDLNLVLQGTSSVTNTDVSSVVHNHGVYVDGYCFYPL